MSEKNKISVIVYKKFSYPKGMLHSENFLEDAINKASSDITNDISEIVKNEFTIPTDSFFEMEAQEEPLYRLRAEKEQNIHSRIAQRRISSVSDIVKALTISYITEKYKITMNPDESPEAFILEPALIDASGRVIVEPYHYLREDIETDYHEAEKRYRNIIDRVERERTNGISARRIRTERDERR